MYIVLSKEYGYCVILTCRYVKHGTTHGVLILRRLTPLTSCLDALLLDLLKHLLWKWQAQLVFFNRHVSSPLISVHLFGHLGSTSFIKNSFLGDHCENAVEEKKGTKCDRTFRLTATIMQSV